MSYEFGPQGAEISNLLNPENRNALPVIGLRAALQPMQTNFGLDVMDLLSNDFKISPAVDPSTNEVIEQEPPRKDVGNVSDLRGYIQPANGKIDKEIFRYFDYSIYHPERKGLNDFVIEVADTPIGKFLFVLSYPIEKLRKPQEVTISKGLVTERKINLDCLQFSAACLLLPDEKSPNDYTKYKAVDLLSLYAKKYGIKYVGLMNSEQNNLNELLPDVVFQDGMLLVKDKPMDMEGRVVTNEGTNVWPIVDRYSWMTWLALGNVERSGFNPELAMQAFYQGDFQTVMEQVAKIVPQKVIDQVIQRMEVPKSRLIKIASQLPKSIRDIVAEWLVPSDLD